MDDEAKKEYLRKHNLLDVVEDLIEKCFEKKNKDPLTVIRGAVDKMIEDKLHAEKPTAEKAIAPNTECIQDKWQRITISGIKGKHLKNGEMFDSGDFYMTLLLGEAGQSWKDALRVAATRSQKCIHFTDKASGSDPYWKVDFSIQLQGYTNPTLYMRLVDFDSWSDDDCLAERSILLHEHAQSEHVDVEVSLGDVGSVTLTMAVCMKQEVGGLKTGNPRSFCAEKAKEPGTFDLIRAFELCRMANICYFGYYWKSKKGGGANADCAASLSTNLKYVLGFLDKEEEGEHRVNHWRCYTPLSEDYNVPKGEGTASMMDGVIFGNETDTQALITCHNEKHYVVLAMRGTKGIKDVAIDLSFVKTKMDPRKDQNIGVTNGGSLHTGFYEAYTEVAQIIIDTLNKLFPVDGSGTYKRLFICGHSLGGALSTIAALSIKRNCPAVPRITVYTFGSPLVGNSKFADEYDEAIPETYRVVNDRDIIPSIPPHFLGFKHVGHLVHVNDVGVWLDPCEKLLEMDDAQGSALETLFDHLGGRYQSYLNCYCSVSLMTTDQAKRVMEAWETLNKVDHVTWEINLNHTSLMPLEISVVKSPHPNAMDALKPEMESLGLSVKDLEVAMKGKVKSGNCNLGYHDFASSIFKFLLDPSTDAKFKQKTLAYMTTQERFRGYDLDGDNYLSRDEFERFLKDTFPEAGVVDTQAACEKLGVPKDHISFTEFGIVSRFLEQKWGRG